METPNWKKCFSNATEISFNNFLVIEYWSQLESDVMNNLVNW